METIDPKLLYLQSYTHYIWVRIYVVYLLKKDSTTHAEK